MRTYYVFNLKKEFKSLYQENPSALFHILKQIKQMDKKEVNYGYTLLSQLIHPLKKDQLDRKLFLKLHRDMSYTKVEEKHCINQLYKDEVSTLEVKRAFLKIESNKDMPAFFAILSSMSDYFFVVDFHHQDYFFLSDLKVLV